VNTLGVREQNVEFYGISCHTVSNNKRAFSDTTLFDVGSKILAKSRMVDGRKEMYERIFCS
jgi:hypothetical protein